MLYGLKSDILRLENIQRRASKCVRCIAHLPYRERLRSLGFVCLENRRKRADLILTWKLLHGVTSCDFIMPPTLRSRDRSIRGHSFMLLPPQTLPPRTRIRSKFFTERVISLWNSLHNSIVCATSLSCFKGRLDHYWTNEVNLPKCSCATVTGICVPLHSS